MSTYLRKPIEWGIAMVVAETVEVETAKPTEFKVSAAPKAARPVSDVVIIRRREDGTHLEKVGAPSFLRKRGIGTGEVQLPEGYYYRGSQAHLDRRPEVGLD